MSDIAELGFAVDSRPLIGADAALNKLAVSADKAERASDRFNKTAAAGRRILDTLASGVRSFGSGVAATAARLGNFGGVLDKVAAGYKRIAAAAVDVDDAMQTNRHSLAGMTAQFQDIAVTSQMGMNSLVIGMQQGTQLAGQISTMERPLQGLAAAFTGLFTPVSILTIGFVTLLAAGLQMVQWGKVAEIVLNALADVIVPIAPYAVAAAAGLALLYAPAIIGGIATLTGMIAGLGVQFVKTAAMMIAANPIGAIILGIGLLITAAIMFRDELTGILGFDIVQAAQDGINWIIGAFVGGFNGIKEAWSLLPAAVGDVAIQMAQAYINAEIDMLNKAKNAIIEFVKWSASITSMIPGAGMINSLVSDALKTGVPDIPNVTLPNPYAGTGAAVGQTFSSAMEDAQGVDYVGKGIEAVKGAASGAADALRGMATAAGKAGEETDKAGKKAAEAYRKVTEGARQFIAEQQLEARALGMSSVQANTLRYAQQLLNQATAEGRTLTAAQRNELLGLASQMAMAEDATNKLTEAYEFGKSTLSSFFSDFKSELMNGTSIWSAFATAGINALDSLANRALEMAANGIWDMIFGAFTGAMGGGSLGNDIGKGISGAFKGGMLSFAGGGDTGNGARTGGIDGMGGFPAILHPQETVTDHTVPSNDNGSVVYFQPQYNISGLGLSAAEVQEIVGASNQQMLDGLPDVIQDIQSDPRKRSVRVVK